MRAILVGPPSLAKKVHGIGPSGPNIDIEYGEAPALIPVPEQSSEQSVGVAIVSSNTGRYGADGLREILSRMPKARSGMPLPERPHIALIVPDSRCHHRM